MADDTAVRRFFLAEQARRAAGTEAAFPSLRAWIEAAAPDQAPVPWHLQQLVALFERALRERVFALVSMPPRHAKSTTVRRALAYAILRHPDRLNGFVTYASSYARTHSRAIKKLVLAHGGQLAPGAKSVDDWRTVLEGGLSVTGRSGQLTGKGFTGLLVLDDLIKNRKEAESILQREQLAESFSDDIYTRSEPPFGSIILVATRWNEDDQTGRLEREVDDLGDKVWEVINLPAIRDPETDEPTDAEDGVALWPERFPLEALKKIRRKIGPYGWWSLYQGRPRPKDGKVFKVCARWRELPEGLHVVLASDPAGSAKTRANHTVTVAVGFKLLDGVLHGWLLGLLRIQLAPPEAAAEQLAFQRRFGEVLHMEGSRDGLAQAEAAVAIAPDLVIRIIRAIDDKFTRAQPLASGWNGNPALGEPPRFFVPESAELIGCSREDLANYLRVFEKFTGQGDVEDDDVDATAHAWNVGQAMDLDSAPPVEPPPVEIPTPWSEPNGF